MSRILQVTAIKYYFKDDILRKLPSYEWLITKINLEKNYLSYLIVLTRAIVTKAQDS